VAITLAQLVREARLRFEGMTQGELAKAIGCSGENVTAIENGRNRRPSPEIMAGLARALELAVEDIYGAAAGTLQHFPWERAGELDLKDPELELMFRQLDSLPEGEPKERVKAFIRFTLDEERRKRRREAEKKK
jgi:DNA-binding XRE family transcriptional regulator